MTKHEADVIGGLNMTDQISNEAYKQIMIAAQDENEPCDDCISRQAVLKIIDGWYDNNRDTENIEDLIVLITYMCSVNPQKPKSEWQQDHEILKAYSDGANAVLDKIRAEIEHMIPCSKEALSMKLGVLEIIDRYTKDGE